MVSLSSAILSRYYFPFPLHCSGYQPFKGLAEGSLEPPEVSDSSGHSPTDPTSPSTAAIHSPLHKLTHTAQPPFVAGPSSSLIYTTAQGSAGLVQTSTLVNIIVPQQQQPQCTIQPEPFKNVLDVLKFCRQKL